MIILCEVYETYSKLKSLIILTDKKKDHMSKTELILHKQKQGTFLNRMKYYKLENIVIKLKMDFKI